MKSALLSLLLLALPACLSTGAGALPAWVDAPTEHPGCSRRDVLCAVGIASGEGPGVRELARQRAVEQIVSSVLVSVENTIEMDATSRQGDEGSFWTDEIRERIRVRSHQEDLPGVEVVERWVHPVRREVYVLVRVRRDLLLDRWLPGVERALDEGHTFLSHADDVAAEDPGRAIHHTLEAWRALSEAYGDAVKANVVARPSPDGGRARAAFEQASLMLADASTRLSELVSGVAVRALSGDGQRGTVRGELGEPLRVRLEYRDDAGAVRPLVDVPVSFATARPGAAVLLPSAATTDASGEVTCRVTDLRPTGLAANEITVRPGFRDVAPDLADTHVPAASFTYHLPTAAGTAVLVVIDEEYEGAPVCTPVVEPALAAHLSLFGFDVRSLSAGRDPILDATGSALGAAVGDDVDIVLRGTASSRYSSEERGLHWYRATARLELVDVSDGRTTALEAGEVKDAHRERSEAGGLRALRLLLGPLEASLEESFVSDYVPGTSRQP